MRVPSELEWTLIECLESHRCLNDMNKKDWAIHLGVRPDSYTYLLRCRKNSSIQKWSKLYDQLGEKKLVDQLQDRILTVMRERGLSQADMAELMGMSTGFWYYIISAGTARTGYYARALEILKLEALDFL